MTAFTEISVTVDGEAAEAVAESLRPFAYQNSVVLEQKGDPESVDPMALEAAVAVKIYVPEAADTPALRRKIEEMLYHMGRLYPIPAPQFLVMEERDWSNAWKDNYHPFRVGSRIWVRPSWFEEGEVAGANAARPGDLVLIMDPGMAFGTGLHPTTQACLVLLEETVRTGDRVLDVGAGTGILAIAAAKLGASRVTAVDTDDLAVQATRQNAELNQVAELVTVAQGDLGVVTARGWEVVVVNILAPVIIDLLSNHRLLAYVAPHGRLILSGIIDAQAPEVEQAILTAGGRIARLLQHRDWVTFLVERAIE